MAAGETPKTDQRYIEGILEGDERVIDAIYTTFFPKITGYVKGNSGGDEDARDLFQEALIVIYRRAQAAPLELSSSFYTYLYSICRNLWLRKLRKKRSFEGTFRGQKEYTSVQDPKVEETMIKTEQYNLYRTKFQLLGEDCKKVLQLFFDGESMVVIAKTMGYKSEQYAKKRKFKCKEQLIRLIREDALYRELADDIIRFQDYSAKKNK